jgi:hypothetical protein
MYSRDIVATHKPWPGLLLRVHQVEPAQPRRAHSDSRSAEATLHRSVSHCRQKAHMFQAAATRPMNSRRTIAWFGAAPAARRARTTCTCPFWLAMNNGDAPSASWTQETKHTRYDTTRHQPLQTPRAATRATYTRSQHCTHTTSQGRHALHHHRHHHLYPCALTLAWFTAAPAASRSRTTSTCPF